MSARVLIALTFIACGDGARDSGFRGAPLAHIEGITITGLHDPNPFFGLDREAHIRGGIFWGTPAARAFDERDTFSAHLEGWFAIDVLVPPPPALVTRGGGAFALGQIALYADADGDGVRGPDDPWLGGSQVLVAWSPFGVRAGGVLVDDLAPGFVTLVPSAPCDVTPLRLVAKRRDDPIEVRIDPRFRPETLFADPGCAGLLDDDLDDTCPSLATTRWWCRHGPATPELCAPCEARLFPQGADPAACEAWYARCVADDVYRDPACWAERRFCLAGEPAPARVCDEACACDNFAAWCAGLDTHPERAAECAREPAGCDGLDE